MKTSLMLNGTGILPKILGKTLSGKYPFQNPILDIASLHSYWDISDIDTLWLTTSKTAHPVDGDPVGCIEDKSGNGRDFTAVSAARPIYRSGNGQPYLDFDGVSSKMTVPSSTASFNFLHNNSGGTIYLGARINSIGLNEFSSFFSNGGQSVLTRGIATNYYNNYRQFAAKASGGTLLISNIAGTDDGNNVLLKYEFGLTGSNVYSAYSDGVQIATSSTATANAGNASQDLTLSEVGIEPIRFYGSAIFETGTALSASDDTAVSEYWNNRMGI